MNNWRELPAGEALDRLIAERLGQPLDGWEWINDGVFRLTDTDEQGRRRHRFMSSYSMNLNKAITLPPRGEDIRFVLSIISPKYRPMNDGDWEADINVGTPEDHRHFIGQADTPALATCRAWLAYDEHLNGEPRHG